MAGLKTKSGRPFTVYTQALDGAVTDIVNNAAHELKEKCQEVCPVDTGTLRNGYDVIEATEATDKAYVINGVEYHDYVDNGTEKMAPRAMTAIAIASLSPDARKYLK